MKVYELATNLTELGHDVFLFLPKLGYPEVQTSSYVVSVPYVDLSILRFISFQILTFLMCLWSIFMKGRPDIIYVRLMWSFLPMLLGKLFKVPVILEVNDSPHRAYSNIRNSFKKRIVHLIDRISYYLSDHILPVTQNIAEDLHHIDGLPWNCMTVLPSGTNTELFRPLDKLACCERLGYNPEKRYVGFIGTFFHYQGIDVLIESAPFIIRKMSDVRFLLVGNGPMRSIWEDKVTEMGFKEYFVFTGQVPYEYVPFYCGVMDVCVSPFLKRAGESSPVKVFDYLACGKPVVMSDVANTGKIFLESEAVILVTPEDQVELAHEINGLLSDFGKREIMGKKGRKFVVSKYERKKLAKDIANLCLEIVNRRQRPRRS